MYIAEMMDRRKTPKFKRDEKGRQQARRGKWTTNADLVDELLKETKQE